MEGTPMRLLLSRALSNGPYPTIKKLRFFRKRDASTEIAEGWKVGSPALLFLDARLTECLVVRIDEQRSPEEGSYLHAIVRETPFPPPAKRLTQQT